MASTLSQKWLTIFCQKAQNFVLFPTVQCTLFDMYLDHMLAKFEPNHMVQSVQNLTKNQIFKKRF